MPQGHRVQQCGHRPADRRPVRTFIVARVSQGVLKFSKTGLVPQFRETGPPQQRAQGRIRERGPVELGEMTVAALVAQQHGIAHVIQRGAVLRFVSAR